MLLALHEDGVLRIYGSVDEAVVAVEALDAEATFRAIFDETGQRYAIQWIRPNQAGSSLPRTAWQAATAAGFNRAERPSR
jgi:hypothetical protein